MNPFLPGHIRLSGDGVFFTIQGEGWTAGYPAIFVRTHECNLKCDWRGVGGELCDAWYTWKEDTPEYKSEPEDVRVEVLAQRLVMMMTTTYCRRVVLTGGEPLLQKMGLDDLVCQVDSILLSHSMPLGVWEVETNGTIPPSPRLDYVAQFNVSPKLPSSGNPYGIRLKTLEYYNRGPNTWWKFVIATDEDVAEVLNLERTLGIESSRIMLMPEGTTPEGLDKHTEICIRAVKSNGWRMCPRLQFDWFGNKRAT